MAKILIVDDEKSVCTQVKIFLDGFGYDSGFIINPDFLLQRLEGDQFDLILMDVHMPKKDGLSLLKTLKGHAIHQTLPVIMLTGETREEILVACFEQGAADYITKPISALTLQARVSAALTIQDNIRKIEIQSQQLQETLEREKELNQLKSRFLSMASHEFRTPLTVISASTEMLYSHYDRVDEKRRQKYCERVEDAVEQMSHLLDEVLILGKVEAGKLQCQPMPLDLVAFCQNLVEEIQFSTQGSHSFTFAKTGDCLEACMDERLLRHIFTNLLSNAVKYSPQGGQISFAIICRDPKVVFQIQDQGIGIPEEDQKSLFDSFHRASNVGGISGTGLGLSIVKQAVDLHKGRIEVESQEGQGTCFTITLPLKP